MPVANGVFLVFFVLFLNKYCMGKIKHRFQTDLRHARPGPGYLGLTSTVCLLLETKAALL